METEEKMEGIPTNLENNSEPISEYIAKLIITEKSIVSLHINNKQLKTPK